MKQDLVNLGHFPRNGAASLTWWYTPVILALGTLRQEYCEFEASQSNTDPVKKEKKKERNWDLSIMTWPYSHFNKMVLGQEER
jgi:hypothetical protein